MHWEAQFESTAEIHEGLVAKFHLPEMGLDSIHWWRAVRTGRWHPVGPRVLRSAGSPATEAQRVSAAVLDASPGAVLHGPSALAWLGVRGFGLGELQVARARDLSGSPAELATLHQLRALRAHDVAVVRGIVTATALRAIWTEAACYAAPARHEIGVQRIGFLLDQAHRLGLVRWAGLHEMVDDIRTRGRSGTVIMRVLAGQRPPGSSPNGKPSRGPVREGPRRPRCATDAASALARRARTDRTLRLLGRRPAACDRDQQPDLPHDADRSSRRRAPLPGPDGCRLHRVRHLGGRPLVTATSGGHDGRRGAHPRSSRSAFRDPLTRLPWPEPRVGAPPRQ